MPDDPLFGPLIDDDEVERAVIAHLQKWWPTYSLWWTREKGEELEDIASWNAVSEDPENRWPEHHLPGVVVVCPGLHDEPVKHGDGTYDISVEVGVAAVVSAADEHDTRRLAHWYAALLRLALLQQPIYPLDEDGLPDTTLAPLADGVRWLQSEPAFPDRARRTLQAKSEVFVIELSDALDADAGPDVPAPDTDLDAPYTAETVTATVEDVDSGES